MNQVVLNALVLACVPTLPRMPVAPVAPVETDAPGVSFAKVSEYAMGVAERTTARMGYEITGLVLTQKVRGAKCIVDGKDAAWMPGDEARKLLKWQAPKQSTPPEGYEPPPTDVDEGEAALGQLAMRLGLGFSARVEHNTGWFVPGIRDAFAGAGAAIEALFERIYTAPDATVYRPGKPGRAAGGPLIVIHGDVTVSGDIFPAPQAVAEGIESGGLTLTGPVIQPAPPKRKPAPEVPDLQESLF